MSAAKDAPRPSLDFPYPSLPKTPGECPQWAAQLDQTHRQWVTRLTNYVANLEQRLKDLETAP